MTAKTAEPTRQCRLVFQHRQSLAHVEDPMQRGISAVASCGRTLFTACDETATVEVLYQQEDGSWGDHSHIVLSDFFRLPDGPDGEMDIEGLSARDGWLWITGSHSLKRNTPDRDVHGAAEGLERLLDIKRDPNRYFLGRIPIIEDEPGVARLKRKDGKRRAASLKLYRHKSALLKYLRDDAHLEPFLGMPCKENGFDIEGLASRQERVWLGLRGPVIRGHAVILEMEVRERKSGRLKPRRIEGKRRYRKHLLDTRGLGVRDLCLDGEDLLVLVGTPLASDGPARVLRWRSAVYDTTSGVVASSRLETVCELPYVGDRDHPEGIERLVGRDGRGGDLLVVHDSPLEDRVDGTPPSLMADLYAVNERDPAS
ncbi:DUF3616 domain-containing protein [Maricaulis sp. CAU 1757]